jgi:hypothetical protein
VVRRNNAFRRAASLSCSGTFSHPRRDTEMDPRLDEKPAGSLAVERVEATLASLLLPD